MKQSLKAESVSVDRNKYKKLQKLLNLWDTDKIRASMSDAQDNGLELEADYHNDSGRVMNVKTRS